LKPATSDACIWLPRLGWQRPDRELRKRLERAFSAPMMVIAAMILPVLAVDLMWWEQVRELPWLSITLDVATRLIWLAFAVEFFVVLAVATRKVRYCTEHWVDVAIILLPFVSFLRIARVLRVGQIFRGGRMVQLARTYRLRGLLTRVVRALLLLKLVERYSPWAAEKRLGGLKASLARKELRQEIR
jgi:voltage-gated potassium channel